MNSYSLPDTSLGPSLRKQALLTDYAEGIIPLSRLSEELRKIQPEKQRVGLVQMTVIAVFAILAAFALPFMTHRQD